MRLLVVGNSHAAAMLSSKTYNRFDQWEGIETDFYVIVGPFAPRLVPRDGRFFPEKETTGLRSTIDNVQAEGLDLSGYDVILFSAWGLPGANNRILKEGRHPLGVAGLVGWEDPAARPLPLVSRGHMAAIIRDFLGRTGGHRFVRDAAPRFAGTIFVQMQADPCERAIADADWTLGRRLGDRVADGWAAFSALRDEVATAMAADLPANVVLLPQPGDLTARPGFIKDPFGRRADPVWHTNHRHGELVLRQIRRHFLRIERAEAKQRQRGAP